MISAPMRSILHPCRSVSGTARLHIYSMAVILICHPAIQTAVNVAADSPCLFNTLPKVDFVGFQNRVCGHPLTRLPFFTNEMNRILQGSNPVFRYPNYLGLILLVEKIT